MSLVRRLPRPLTRDSADYRDDRLFIIACDDTYAPKQYFGFFEIPRIKVFVAETKDGTSTAERVLERLEKYQYQEHDERWMLLDTDHCDKGTHLKSFTKAIREAKEKNISVALSKPCFEIWLLLHHAEESEIDSISSASEAELLLRSKLGAYNKRNLKKADYSFESLLQSCIKSEKLFATDLGGDIPKITCSQVHLVWNSIVEKSSMSQLPEELRALKKHLRSGSLAN